MELSLKQFEAVVRNTVLVGIDLLLINERGEVLVGMRRSAPARGLLFVPGGRVRKGESLAEALQRVVKRETGLEVSPQDAVLQGVYDHFYEDSFFGPEISTQYSVIACRCRVRSGELLTPDDQHESLVFMAIDALLADPRVHPYTKNYFREGADNQFLSGNGGPVATAAELAENRGHNGEDERLTSQTKRGVQQHG